MPRLSTQQFSEIDQIREGIIVLRNKALRGVLMVSSINFALKPEEEQTAIINQFQDFLNSLDFPCQIVVQSRKLNITGYLDKLQELEKTQENEFLKVQTASYREFIRDLVRAETIMTKTFFVVVPFTLFETMGISPKALLTRKPKMPALTEEMFQRCKTQLWQRMEFVALGLRRSGLQVVPLNTPELIELFWAWYHPREAESGYFPEIPPELIQ